MQGTNGFRDEIFSPFHKKILLFDSLPSTNLYVKEIAKKGAPEGTVCIAKTQTAGRGRMDRSFYSPPSTGLYMSILFRPKLIPSDFLHITALAAVAVAETAEMLTGHPAGIKWVNDIYYKERKVSGILAESAFDPLDGSLSYIVLGIGLNLATPEDNFPPQLSDIAGALFTVPDPALIPKAASGILERLHFYYMNADKKAFIEPYKSRSILIGRSVRVFRGNESFPAFVLGINDDFSLRIRLEGGQIMSLASGEVSIRYDQ